VNPRVVDQAVDPSESIGCLLHDALRGVGSCDVARNGGEVRVIGGGIKREVPTTPVSFHEVGLVDHASGLAPSDTDEHAFVQPAEIGATGLDLR
jgi:hypothetical protein